MDELADMMINEGRNADEIMDATGMDEEELTKRYLENWYSIKDTADELWMDEWELCGEHWDNYDKVFFNRNKPTEKS